MLYAYGASNNVSAQDQDIVGMVKLDILLNGTGDHYIRMAVYRTPQEWGYGTNLLSGPTTGSAAEILAHTDRSAARGWGRHTEWDSAVLEAGGEVIPQ